MIGAIARHEGAAQLRSVQTWVVAALLAALFGFLFLQRVEDWLGVQAELALADNPPGLTGFLAARFLAPLALVFGLVAPLFAMRAVADEFRSGAAPLWQSSPVSDGAFALGKLAGALVVPLALAVLATLMVGSMALFVDVDAGAVAAAFLGLALATAAFAAIGLYFSSLARQPLVAVLAALAFVLLLWLAGSGATAGGALPAGVADALRALSIGDRLGGFFQGYVRSADVLYLVLLALLFVALTVIRLDALRRRGTRLHVLLSALVVGIALALGWLGTRFDAAVDVTANARHSLSPTSVAAARALEGPVTMTAVLRAAPAQVEALEALVARFREYKSDITLEIVNPDTDPARARALDAAPGGDLILAAGNREQRLQTLSERTLAGALRRLGADEERDVLFVTGHEERRPSGNAPDDWGELAARLASGGLVARETSLVAEPRIDDEVDVVVVAAPRRPYFPGEVASLVDHFRRGGNLLWLSETPTGRTVGQANGQADGGASGDGRGPGLDALALELGIETLPGTVVDAASLETLGGTDSPDFVVLDRFPAHPVTRSLASPVLLPEVRALAAVPLAGQTLAPLLQTPEASWTESGPLEGAVRFDAGGDEVAGPLLLGIAIEREVDGRTQRVAVLGDADFAASRFLGNGANAAFAESLLLWLAGDDDALDFVVRPAPDAELVLGPRAIIALGAVLLVGVPLALLLVGLAVGLARRRERRRDAPASGAPS